MKTREVYRDKRGRFVSYWDLWQGPHQHPVLIEGAAMLKWMQALTIDATKASYIQMFRRG